MPTNAVFANKGTTFSHKSKKLRIVQSFTEKYQLHHQSKLALPHLQHSLLPTNPPLPTNVACLEEKNPQNFHTKAGNCKNIKSLWICKSFIKAKPFRHSFHPPFCRSPFFAEKNMCARLKHDKITNYAHLHRNRSYLRLFLPRWKSRERV